MNRVLCLACVLVACKQSVEERKAAPVPMTAIDAAAVVAAPIDAASSDAARDPWGAVIVDAGATVEAAYDNEVQRYLAAYLDLLWADLTLAEMLSTYPGAPPTDRYNSFTYKWRLPDRERLEKVLRRADAAATHEATATPTDRAVRDYTSAVLLVWPEVRGLADYYIEQAFVDDEFARGRRDAPLVAQAIAKIAPMRAAMREAVFDGWRRATNDKPESPRAVITASWELCMRAAILVYSTPHAPEPPPKAKPKPDKADDVEKAIDTAISECRRSVGKVSALPMLYSSMTIWLRSAAVAFGDASSAAWARKYAIDNVEKLVKEYVANWPKLPAAPAEKPEQVE